MHINSDIISKWDINISQGKTIIAYNNYISNEKVI